jgi:lysozyme
MDYKRLQDTLIRHEAMRLKLYKCSEGKNTIGVGHNIDDKGITEKQALMILDDDIKESEEHLRKFSWFEGLSDVRQEVVLNLHFNVGHTSFLGFKKMIWALENGDYLSAGEEMKDSKWYNQVGIRAKQLVEAMQSNSFFPNNKPV